MLGCIALGWDGLGLFNMHFNFIQLLLFHGHEHVSATHVAFYRVISLRIGVHL